MRKELKEFLTCLAGYVIAGFLTFGYCYNHPGPEGYDGQGRHAVGSAVAGFLWPIWVFGQGSLWIMR